MERLLQGLQIPSFYICQQRTHASGMEALMILLRRMVYPNRWCDLMQVFGRSIPELSLIYSEVSTLHYFTAPCKMYKNSMHV